MKTVTTHYTDDIDGTPDAQPLTFAVGGHTYDIDLGPANTEKLHDLLAPYIDNARRTTSRTTAPKPRRPRTPSSSNGHHPTTDHTASGIRQWWKDNPDTLPTWQAKGAIPHAVLRAHQQANG